MSDLKTELMKIRDARGRLTPRIVYEEAKSKSHPLHDKIFDVPAKEAAERYYIGNAAKLLRVTFSHTADSGETRNLRHFWVVKDKAEGTSEYVPIEEVVADPMTKKIMLQQMMRDWKHFKARYAHYAEFSDVVLKDPDFVDPDEEFGEPANGTEG